MINNVDLASDVIAILEAIKQRTQQKIEVNFFNLDNEVAPPPTASSVDIPDSVDNVSVVVEKPPSLDFTIALLSRSTRGAHTELRKKFIETFNFPGQQLPSHHKMTKK